MVICSYDVKFSVGSGDPKTINFASAESTRDFLIGMSDSFGKNFSFFIVAVGRSNGKRVRKFITFFDLIKLIRG